MFAFARVVMHGHGWLGCLLPCRAHCSLARSGYYLSAGSDSEYATARSASAIYLSSKVPRELRVWMVGEPQPNVIGVIFRFAKERANVVIVQRVCDRIPTPVRLHQT